jgi:hypothetical protein
LSAGVDIVTNIKKGSTMEGESPPPMSHMNVVKANIPTTIKVTANDSNESNASGKKKLTATTEDGFLKTDPM